MVLAKFDQPAGEAPPQGATAAPAPSPNPPEQATPAPQAPTPQAAATPINPAISIGNADTPPSEQGRQQSAEDQHKDKLTILAKAMGGLDQNNPEHFNKDGRPNARYLGNALGFHVTIPMRDEVWGAISPARVTDHTPAPAEGPTPSPQTAAQTAQKEIAARSGMWMVYDTNATHGVRLHKVREDHGGYQLSAKTGTLMPKADAAKFLIDPAFRVLDENGQPVTSLPSIENMTSGRSREIVLQHDETVAKLGELTDRALLLRVNRYPGGEVFIDGSDRETMIRFYIDARARLQAGTADTGLGDGMVGDLGDDVARASLDQAMAERRAAGITAPASF